MKKSNGSDQHPQVAPVAKKAKREVSFERSNIADGRLYCLGNNAALVEAHLGQESVKAAMCVQKTAILPLAKEQDKKKRMSSFESCSKRGIMDGAMQGLKPSLSELNSLLNEDQLEEIADPDCFYKPIGASGSKQVSQVEKASAACSTSFISLDVTVDKDAAARRRQRQAKTITRQQQSDRLLKMLMIQQQVHKLQRQLLEDQQHWQRQQGALLLTEIQQQQQNHLYHQATAATAGIINNSDNELTAAATAAARGRASMAFQKLAARQLADQQMLVMKQNQEFMKALHSYHHATDLASP